MLLRSYLKDTPGKQLIGFGMACMSTAGLITVSGGLWIDEPTFLIGFMYGIASVLAGLSIVLNLTGMQRLRVECDRT